MLVQYCTQVAFAIARLAGSGVPHLRRSCLPRCVCFALSALVARPPTARTPTTPGLPHSAAGLDIPAEPPPYLERTSSSPSSSTTTPPVWLCRACCSCCPLALSIHVSNQRPAATCHSLPQLALSVRSWNSAIPLTSQGRISIGGASVQRVRTAKQGGVAATSDCIPRKLANLGKATLESWSYRP